MPVSFEQDEARYIVRLEGEIGVTDAAEIKRLLLEGLASGRSLHVDLDHVERIDVTFMQLLYGAVREAARSGTELVLSLSGAAETALLSAGFGPGIGRDTPAEDRH